MATFENLATPEQQVAIERAEANVPPMEIFVDVANSIPHSAPDVEPNRGWSHGSCRRTILVGSVADWMIEEGMLTAPIGDLSDIKYAAFYRQAVANKNTGEVKHFYVTVPLASSGVASPGQTFEIGNAGIPFNWGREDVEAMAKESFLKLQEMVLAHREAEA